jgi:hypothetical protein
VNAHLAGKAVNTDDDLDVSAQDAHVALNQLKGVVWTLKNRFLLIQESLRTNYIR